MDEALRQAIARLIRNNKDILLDDDIAGDAAIPNATDIRTIEAAIKPPFESSLAQAVHSIARRYDQRAMQNCVGKLRTRTMMPYV